MDPIIKPFILRSNRKTLLPKPFLLITQPLRLHLIHPQNLGRKQDKCMLRKKMWIPSTLEREKEKRGIFALHDSEVFEEKREKKWEKKGRQTYLFFSSLFWDTRTREGEEMLDHLRENWNKGLMLYFPNQIFGWRLIRRVSRVTREPAGQPPP